MTKHSFQSKLATKLLPFASKRVFPPEWLEAGDDLTRLQAIAKKRRAFDGPRPDFVLQRKWGRATTEIAGRELHLLTPKGGSFGRVLFYCHGGAFVVGPSALEWLFAAKVAHALGCDLALYDYAKVPDAASKTIRGTTLTAYRTIEERYGTSNIVIGGTSAGGGLAASTLLQLARDGRDLPVAGVLFSPWLDMTISHDDAPDYVQSDRLLPIESLRRDGALYAGTTDARDPLVSPRFAPSEELAGLSPMVVTAGDQEILFPEAQEFVANLSSAGVDATLLVESNGQHAGVVGATPEAAAVLEQLYNQLRRTW